MSDAVGTAASAAAQPGSAGRLLREARERQGLHIAALAASIKVTPKKLEMLEADRFDALPDATFTRALAQTVCRALKIDPGPVMRLLPPPAGHRLEHVSEGLNAPFRDRPGVLVQRDWPGLFASPAFWITALILAAAAVIFFLPSGLIGRPSLRQPAASAAMVPASAGDLARVRDEVPGMPPEPRPGDETVPAGTRTAERVPEPGATTSATAGAAAGGGPAGLLQLRASTESWVEITDARGQTLISRLLQPGEEIGLEGVLPLKVRIGNASATRLTFRGKPTELAAFTRDNVARLELR